MELALLVLLALALAVGAAALTVGLLANARLRTLLEVARAARQEVHELSQTVTTNVVNVVERRGLRPLEDRPTDTLSTPFGSLAGLRPTDGPTVQDRADDAPTQTYGAVRPDDHA